MNERIERLQSRLQADEVDAFLVTQNVDIYYFTGSMQAGYLLVPAEVNLIFYVRRSVSRAVSEASVRVEPLGSFRAFGERIAKDFPHLGRGKGSDGAGEQCCKIATEFNCLPVQLYHRLQKVIPQAEWIDGSVIVRELRMLKSPEEVNQIRQCGVLIGEALEHALSIMKVGMTGRRAHGRDRILHSQTRTHGSDAHACIQPRAHHWHGWLRLGSCNADIF